MDVILLRDVEKVGLRGDVVQVSRGFMRNYLQPRRLAEPATPALVAELEKREAQRARHEARSHEQAREIAETLAKTVLTFEVKSGPRGRLFGSVTPTNIVDEIWRTRKIRVDRRKIDLPETIKRVGRYDVPIGIFDDVRVDVKTLVVPEGGELPSEDEIAAWEAEERAEALAAAGVPEEAAEAPAEGEEPAPAEAEEGADGEPAAEGEGPAETETEPESEPEAADSRADVEAAWAAHEAAEASEPAGGPAPAEGEAGAAEPGDEAAARA